jgi:hypothetical protein
MIVTDLFLLEALFRTDHNHQWIAGNALASTGVLLKFLKEKNISREVRRLATSCPHNSQLNGCGCH